jgi:hypothetical protein
MELKGKIGSQHKFPRVMKGKMLEQWNKFLETGVPLIFLLTIYFFIQIAGFCTLKYETTAAHSFFILH